MITLALLPGLLFLMRFNLHLQSLTEGNMTDVSIISFKPQVEDDGRYLTCRAENPSIGNSAIEDKWHLTVHCEYWRCYFRFHVHDKSIDLLKSTLAYIIHFIIYFFKL